VTSPNTAKHLDSAALDRLTGGAFSAATSGERASRIREWLLSEPAADQLAEVFRELSVKDKGAAKLVRERLDDVKRAKGQEQLAAEWASRAQLLVDANKLNMADALAWQRDAAKAGAPLSKEPLLTLKGLLVERVKAIEDLQHQVQVQREAAVLLAQRIEVLSTKPWADAQAALEALRVDVAHWQDQATALIAHASWPSVDLKFPPLLDASRAQLLVVWDAFGAALNLAVAAAADAAAPLPPVPVWADELRAARGLPAEPVAKVVKPKVDPEIRAAATAAVTAVLQTLEQEVGEGHGKASTGAANALRQALKEHGKALDGKLENRAHAALAAAGELEGWQRWRADQIREELVAKAEGLLARPEGQALGGRKMQETLRALRDQWKQTDQGGVPNHGLWKRFDEACNAAYQVVQAWLDKVKTESAEHKAQRLALIAELQAWAEANRTALDDDWKGFNRLLHQFADRWRDAGHIGEKMFAELQPQWKAALAHAAQPLEALQAQSLVVRHAMIEEAKVLGAAPVLRVDAVKALQQRWQAEAHAVPIERRQEQKLWDAFRKPIDEAFNRKTAERQHAEAELGARDRVVLDASKALQAANASGDARAIRSAMAALDAALQGRAQAQVDVQSAVAQQAETQGVVDASNQGSAGMESAPAAPESVANESAESADVGEASDAVEVAPTVPPVKAAPPRPVVAMRGDDRPGTKKETPMANAGRPGKWGDRKDSAAPRGGRDAPMGDRGARRDGRDGRDSRFGRDAAPDAPRLGDTAYRAQRDAMEHAQLALKKLEAQAHGEALTHLMSAWEQRAPTQVPAAQDFGGRAVAPHRANWVKALEAAPQGEASTSLLRLEMAAELPTPAEHLDARRAMQLQLLTRRNDPSPAQTWGQDAAAVLAAPFQAGEARRLQNALKVLLRK
jgi:ATP-dependent RNA helicase SUPV3L1/SUV3